MNKKFVYQVGNNKKSYTMMHGQPNIKIYWICQCSVGPNTNFLHSAV